MEAHQRRMEAYLWQSWKLFKPRSQSDRKSPPSFRIEAHLWQFWKNLSKPRSLEAFSGCKGRIEAHQRKKLKEYLQKYCKDTRKAHK